ncbi:MULTISPECIES: dihydrolipoamide acetyltransferase family protein [Streptomyces]|uniref:dihydrolipoamide acetyltransferase family protein n=1 Tax=Streptomyces lycopersici TaxID=2974589 RepID=UPI0021D314B2|nr:dihydrolipoamide acetyltransferase family protein [Streptomyces sp. NEAU-383]
MTAVEQRFREFKMPDVGEGLTEAEILKWFVAPGDTVTDGQVVCEVETAKAAVELPIPFDGVVHEVRFDEGATVDVGTPIISVDTDPGAGEAAPQAAPAAEAPAAEKPAAAAEPEEKEGRQANLVGYGAAPASTKRRPRKPLPGVQRSAPAPSVEAPAPQEPAHAPSPSRPEAAPAPTPTLAPSPELNGSGRTARPLAKPPVRKLAKDLGIDLETVTPSGADGIITREDVHAAAEAVQAAREAPVAAPSAATTAAAQGRERRVPVKGVRKATAQAMVHSAFTAPHVTEFVTVDVTRTMKLVAELKQDPELSGLRVNPLLLVAKALLVAIRRNPDINAAWDDDNQEIIYKDYVNLGIAAATPRGLIVPNIKDADAKTLPELASALGELVTTAREGKTTPAAMSGGTITITNVGVFGIDAGTPIINPGESAILAFGAVKLQPWVHKGEVKPRQVTTLALSFDHRLVDGELGSKVLADVAAVLERPKRLITWA